MDRRWWALVLLCLAQFMVILDVTVVNVALPVIGQELELSRATATWVVIAYTLCFGGLMLLGGRLADVLGRRRVVRAGLVVFTVASLVSGLASNGAMLVGARAAQGVGAALLSPAALSLVTTTFDVPAREGSGGRVDLTGALLVTSAGALLIYGLIEAAWSSASTWVPLAVGFGLAIAFAVSQRRSVEPLVRFSLLTRRPMVAGIVIMLAATGMLVGSFFLSSLYLQRALGFSALRAGLVFLPVAVAITIGAHLASRLIGRFGSRSTAVIAFLLAALGLLWLSMLPEGGNAYTDLLPGFLVAGVGLGAAFVTATITALARTDPHDSGVASGTINASHELGASLGVATVSTIASSSLTVAHNAAVPVTGFDNAFLVLSMAALALTFLIAFLVPAGRLPVHDGPIMAH